MRKRPYNPKRATIERMAKFIREIGGWVDDSGRVHGPWSPAQLDQTGGVQVPTIDPRRTFGADLVEVEVERF